MSDRRQPKEVAPGIYQITLEFHEHRPQTVQVYLLKGKENTLVDTGWPTDFSRTSLVDQLATIGVAPADIGTLVMTHLHIDHCGQANWFQREFGTRLIYPRGELVSVPSPDVSDETLLDEMNRFVRSYGVPDDNLTTDRFLTRVTADQLFDDGDILSLSGRSWRAVATPGHSVGHSCLISHDGIMLSGDHILPGGTTYVAMVPETAPDPLGTFLTSLDHIGKETPRLAFPGHGDTMVDFQSEVSGTRKRLFARLDALEHGLESEPRTAYAIAQRKYERPDRPWNFKIWRSWVQFMVTVADLAYLASQERIRTDVQDGMTRYWRI